MIYEKLPITIDIQIAQLKQRGLLIANDDTARHYLSSISYYRLAVLVANAS